MTEIRSATQRQRDKIRSGKIVERLIAHVRGEIELTNSQVNAAKALMAKILPDLKNTEVQGRIEAVSTVRLSDAQLMQIAARGLKREAVDGEAERVQEPLKLGSKSNGTG